MKIELHQVTIRELTDGYNDMDDEGVVAYGGKLNVRPKYQRNFVYGENARNEVIRSIMKGYPINVMYWAKNEDGTFEMLDGQQRTISICDFVGKKFSINAAYFQTLTDDEREKFLDYQLQVYFCEGTDKEKLEWFKIINIATMVLTAQELRNAVYTGEWLTDAKRKFSKRNCVASRLNDGFVSGDPNRQALLENVLLWAAEAEGIGGQKDDQICQYMANHQYDKDANREWQYFQDIIYWAKKVFENPRHILKGQPWGEYYNKYHETFYNSSEVETTVARLMKDDDVTNKKGIVEYVLDKDERHLSLRAFTQAQKEQMYEQQQGICPGCGKHFEIYEMEADHKQAWSKGGKTELANGQMLCEECNRKKSDGKLIINEQVINMITNVEQTFEPGAMNIGKIDNVENLIKK